MANCGKSCPYYYRDSDCEYCGARNGEVIDCKDYSYKTCPYYREYLQSQGKKPPQHDDDSEEMSGCGGCGCSLLVYLPIVIFISYPFLNYYTDGAFGAFMKKILSFIFR